jgi:putative ABC transport system permease protein
MNIMLVAVAERTREIGTRKAIGAKSAEIKQQFLFEAILICQLGGLLGVFLGILIGNLVSILLNSPFVIPWGWIVGGLVISFIVGLASGYIPAVKASKLDPIEALRYE